MKVTRIGNQNATVVTLERDGKLIQVLYSYSTPVAYLRDGKAYKSKTKYSITTSRHINQWMGRYDAEVEQAEIDTLVKG